MVNHRKAAVSTCTMWPALVMAAVTALVLLPSASSEDMACSSEVCVSPTRDELVFLDEEFRRVCHYTGPPDPGADLEWLRDGQPVGSALRNFNQLIIEGIVSSDTGTYSCRGTLVADGTIIGPVPAGTITVFEISVPADPYILNGTSYNLTCQTSVENPQIFWRNVSSGEFYTDSPVLSLTSVNITTEGDYTCEVVHISGRTETTTVTVHVVVPHLIISNPPPYQPITGNLQETFTVEFQGREEQNSTVSWFKDGVALTSGSSQRRIETTFLSEQLRGTSSLVFDEISRGDAGVYQMMLDSNLGVEIFPDDQRRAETSFQVDVVVPPSLPTSLTSTAVDRTTVRVTWVLTNRTTDAGADTLTLVVRYSQKIDEYSLPGGETALLIPVVPGTEYEFTLTARNQDGSETTQPVLYQTPPGAPSISNVHIVRMNETSFHLRVGVDYTGGGDITHFDVSFRHSDSGTGFDPLGLIPATVSPNSVLEWNSVITIPELREIDAQQLHFRVSALNSHGLRSMTEAPENLVLPGAPQPSLNSSSTTSLTISVQLSQEGSAPILQITALVTNSELQFSSTHNLSGPFNPGETVNFTAEDLSPEEPFVVITYATNVAGIGPSSQAVNFTTVLESNSSIPIPLWALVAIGGGTVILVLVSVTCAVTCYRYRRRRPRKQNYNVNKRPQKPIARKIGSPLSADMHRLDSSNPLVTRPDKTISLTNGGFTMTTFLAPKPQDNNKHHTDGPDNLVQRNTSTTSFEDSPPTTKSRLERGSSTALPQRSSQAVSSTTLGSNTPVSVKREPDLEASDDENENENEDSGVEVERSNPALPQGASSTLPRSSSIPRGVEPNPQFQRELTHRVQSRSSSALPQETSVQRSASMAIPGAAASSSSYGAKRFEDSGHQMKSESAHALSLTGNLYRTASASVTHTRGAPLPQFNQQFRNETVSTSSCNASASEVTDSSVDLVYPQYMPSLHDYHGESIHSLPTLRSGITSVHSTQESSIQYPVHVYSSQYVSDV